MINIARLMIAHTAVVRINAAQPLVEVINEIKAALGEDTPVITYHRGKH